MQNKQRLRAQIELVFPEFLSVINSDIDTARLLLKDYFLPQHYLKLDVENVAAQMESVSLKQHGEPLFLVGVDVIRTRPDRQAQALATQTILVDQSFLARQNRLDQLETVIRRLLQIADDLLQQGFTLSAERFRIMHRRISGIKERFLKIFVTLLEVFLGFVVPKTGLTPVIRQIRFHPGDKRFSKFFLLGCESKIHISAPSSLC